MNKENLYFTSDLHVFDKKILNHQDRKVSSVEEMNERIKENWNKTVPKDGVVYNLGDFFAASLMNKDEVSEYIKGLNGIIYLILGNHDKEDLYEYLANNELKGKLIVCPLIHKIKVNIEGKIKQIILCHYPMREWPSFYYKAWHLYGHTHGNTESFKLSMDVGIDCHPEFRPFTFQEIENVLLHKYKGNKK